MLFSLLLSATALLLQPAATDTIKTIDMNEIVVKTTNKQTSQLRNTATSATIINHAAMERQRIGELSDLNSIVPNFFMPKYGSRLSSALYIRGIGSRINTPAVALYVDDAPIAEKSEYTLNFLNMDRMEILRGPQGTLYGRNAMGGILSMYTRNPFYFQGTDIKVGTATRNERISISAVTNQKISDKIAFSLGGFYDSDKGFFHNDSLGKKVGGGSDFGANARIMFRPAEQWLMDLKASYEYSDEDGYPYFYDGQVSGDEISNAKGRITSNRQSTYRRSMFNTHFKLSWEGKPFIFNSVTSYRNLDDRMLMDQDFVYKDFFTLEQRQRGNTLSEEITLKSKPFKRWEWTGGIFGLWEALRTHSPVTFYSDGVDMLNTTIARHIPTPTVTITNPRTGQPVTQAMPMSMTITDPFFDVPAYFHTPVLNGALFFQNTLHDVFIPRFSITLGLRLDHERQEMSYTGGKPVNFNFAMPSHQINNDMATTTFLKGKIKNNHTTLLPKVALQYDFENQLGNIYLSVAKGQRSGGYNIQMFSDILSTVMQNDMMQSTKDYLDATMDQHAQQMPAMAAMFNSIKQAIDDNIPISPMPDISNTVTYQPEYCWSYEGGTHLNLLDNRLTADFSIFFMDIRNQQISRFVSSGLGRIMVNAGRSHSCGMELGLTAKALNDRLTLHADYGYTHSEFRKYNTGQADYRGHHVPFIPEHNIGLIADYNIVRNHDKAIKNITVGIQGNGLGRIYWNEENTAWQDFYCTLKSHILLDFGPWDINLWGDNLTCSQYNSFYFESSQRKYYQKGTPFQLGVDVHWHF